MKTTDNYGLKKPEETDFYDVQDQNDNMDIIDAKMKEIEEASDPSALEAHVKDAMNPHFVTKTQIGLGNVPNVSTNNQTPTYTVPSEVSELESGEKVSVAFGKIAKAISHMITKFPQIEDRFGVVLTQALQAGSTEITFTDSAITESSMISVYTDVYGVNPTEASVTTGNCTLTFDAQESDVSVRIEVR